jgi:hypothetical protein
MPSPTRLVLLHSQFLLIRVLKIWNVAAPVAHLLWNIGTEFEVSIVFEDPQLFSR